VPSTDVGVSALSAISPPALREHLRDALADAVARTGDENRLARDIEFGWHQMGNSLGGNDGLASGPASSSMSRRAVARGRDGF